jgi:hypothetical protein
MDSALMYFGLVWALLPPLLGIAALVASTSRGGILAFIAALTLAVVGRARRGWWTGPPGGPQWPIMRGAPQQPWSA